MKEIDCPYIWDCGIKILPKELSEHDFNFIESAIKKKMGLMYIHCPKCTRDFRFDPLKWKSTAIYLDPNIEVLPKNKKTTQELTSILKNAKIEIPQPYFDYLISKKFDNKVSIFIDEENFVLYDLDELCEKMNIDGKSFLTISQLKGFAGSLKKIFGTKKMLEQEFTFTALSKCLSIGQENTSVLFIDFRDNNSLWIFHPDGGDIEKLKINLDKIISENKFKKVQPG